MLPIDNLCITGDYTCPYLFRQSDLRLILSVTAYAYSDKPDDRR